MAARFGSTRTARVSGTVVCRHPRRQGPITRITAGPSDASPRAVGVTVYSTRAGRWRFHRTRDGCNAAGTRSFRVAGGLAGRALTSSETRLATPTESRSAQTRSTRNAVLPGARRESTTIAAAHATNSTAPARSSAGTAAPLAISVIDAASRPAPRQVTAGRSPRDRHPPHRALDGGDLGNALDLRLGTPDHAVTQRRDAHVLDVVGNDVVPALDGRHGFAGEEQRDRSPRARTKREVRAGPGRRPDRGDVPEHLVGDAHPGDLGADRRECRGVDDRCDPRSVEVMRIEPAIDAAQQDDLGRRFGHVHLELEEEAIELRLGERVRALVLDGVLGGHDKKTVTERAARSGGRDLTLLHRLEEGRLRFRRRSVDLVGKQGG